MKKFPAVLLALLPVAAVASEAPTLAFPETKIGLPPLSLAAGAASAVAPPAFDNPAPLFLFRDALPPSTAARKFVSHMPVVAPRDEVDPHMPVKTPDSSVDYKMIVKTPDLDVRK